jgi:flavin reductase (DIM6/NTAB) family NADH-FMN oxidoreductase RutF
MDSRPLRKALGRFATGVTIVSCCDAGGRYVGLTVNSFNTVSLQPPLVLWSLRRESPNLGAFTAARHFAVNVLAENQIELSRRFASRAADKFATGHWTTGAHGAPLLEGSVAVFECETVSQQVAGDHLLFIGRVLACSETALAPLLFQGGHYQALGNVL